MSADPARRARRARLASNDEREGGGFTLPSFIMAAVDTIMDSGDTGAELAVIVEAVAVAASTDKTRIHHIWKGDSREASMTLMVDDLLQELVDADYVRWADDRLIMAPGWQGAGEDGGHWVKLNLNPHGTHRALVFERELREQRVRTERNEFNLRSALLYIARPRIDSQESQARIAELVESMHATGYDSTKPILVDEDGSVLAGHHRAAAADLAGVTPARTVVVGLEAQVRAVWRDNDGRRWSTDERERIAAALNADGRTPPQIATALNVSLATVYRDLKATRNGRPPKRPTKRNDPVYREQVARLLDEGLTHRQIAECIDGLGESSVGNIAGDLEAERARAAVAPEAPTTDSHVRDREPTFEIDPPQIEQPESKPPTSVASEPEPETDLCPCCMGTGRVRKTAPA